MEKAAPPPVLDIDALIDSRTVGPLQLVVALLGAAGLFVEGFDTQVIGYIVPAIARQWHVAPDMIGTLLSADIFGLLLGYLVLSPFSARFGHKRMLIACTSAFGVLTFLSVSAGSPDALIFFRFLTGIGVGGAMPSAVALTGEYCPERRRSTFITLIYCGYSFGQIGAGLVAAALLQNFGWRAVLAVGGTLPLLLVLLFFLVLPESLEYLVNRAHDRTRAERILRRLAPEMNIAPSTRLVSGPAGPRKTGVGPLLKDGRALGTGLVWTGMFMNLMIYFFMQKWLTTILIQVGLPQQTAIVATSVGLAGGIIAAVIIGPLMDRFGPYAVVAGLFVASALAVTALASVLTSHAALLLTGMALLMGFCLSGGQKANNALAVYFYPTALRGTGLGWGLGIGRVGGALGPMLPGYLLARGWLPADLFYAAAIPMLAGAAAIAWMGHVYTHDENRAVSGRKPQITP